MKNNIKDTVIKDLFNLADENFKRNPFLKTRGVSGFYTDEIKGEVDEVKAEMKKNNRIFLEDELGDVFWDYLMLLKILEKEGYIDSVENVFTHSFEKFQERYSAIWGVDDGLEYSEKRGLLWDKVK